MIRNVWTIARRELTVYFSSPIGYVILALFALLTGYFFAGQMTAIAEASRMAAMQPGGPPINVNLYVIQPVIQVTGTILLFLVPMLTMRLFAEEKRTGTIELLLTSPITDYEIILGKWLGAMLLYGCMLLVMALNFATIFIYTTPDWKAMLVGFLGLLLVGGALLSLGGFISTLTRNQIVAGVGAFVLFLVLWVMGFIGQFSDSTWGKLVQYTAMIPHFESFARGVIELKDVVYYVSATALGLFLSKRSLESIRWSA